MTKRSRRDVSRRTFPRGSTAGLAAGAVAGSLAGRTEDAAAVEAMGPKFENIVNVTLKVNGVEHRLTVEPRVTLLDALRERLALTGTKKGCNYGECGAYTVRVRDGLYAVPFSQRRSASGWRAASTSSLSTRSVERAPDARRVAADFRTCAAGLRMTVLAP